MWRRPANNGRVLIGQLWRDALGYGFSFEPDLERALAEGFTPPGELSQEDEKPPLRSQHLFATFAQRIPHRQRPDFDVMMRSWGVVDTDDPFEILAKSGGILMTDRLELAEYRSPTDPLDRPLEMRIAAMEHGARQSLTIGETVTLRRELENPADSAAVQLIDGNRQLVGYVPRQYSSLVARILDAGDPLRAVIVRELLAPEGRWVARVERPSAS